MKKIILIQPLVFFFCLVVLLFNACDKIEQPYEQEQVTGPITGVEVKSDSSKINLRKLLLEDYTGHKCGNCPKAIDTIHSILNLFPEQVIPVSIHSGYYSTYNTSPYNYNWVVESPTQPGYNALDEFFQVSAQGNPNGMVNRKDFDLSSFTHVKGIDQWKNDVGAIVSLPTQATLYLVNVFDENNNNLKSTIHVRFLNALAGTYKLGTMLVEDEVLCDTLAGRVVPQKDYRINPDDDFNYHHEHVLRGYLFGAFGDSLMTNPSAGDTISKVYTKNIALQKNPGDTNPYYLIPGHLHVIAYIYNAITFEIIQAEELKIKP